jgi:hypothetical protein
VEDFVLRLLLLVSSSWLVLSMLEMQVCFIKVALRLEGARGSGCMNPSVLELFTSWR